MPSRIRRCGIASGPRCINVIQRGCGRRWRATMSKRVRQSGLTMISWIILIGLIGFVGMFGFKLMPIYLEYGSVNKALTTAASGATSGETPAQLRSTINELFDVNSINDIQATD